MRTVGGLTALLGLALADGARRHDLAASRVIALGSAPVYAAADLHAGRRFSRVYLADLAVQCSFVAAWLGFGSRRPRGD